MFEGRYLQLSGRRSLRLQFAKGGPSTYHRKWSQRSHL